MPRGALTLCAWGLAWTLIGCASELFVPVRGVVTVNGKPLTNAHGSIIFYPDESKGNKTPLRVPMAKLHPDGTYELNTYEKAGVPLGWYKVVVQAMKDPIPARPPHTPGDKPWKPPWLVDDKYTKPYTTPIAIEVVKEPPAGQYDLHLTR